MDVVCVGIDKYWVIWLRIDIELVVIFCIYVCGYEMVFVVVGINIKVYDVWFVEDNWESLVCLFLYCLLFEWNFRFYVGVIG